MSKIARFAVLVASLMSLFAMMSATAGAVTWDNRGSTTFTATNPSTGTLSSTGVNLVCHSATATGTAPNGTITGNTYSVAGTATFSPCFISGITTTVACGYTLTTSSTASPFTGNADVTCDVTQFGVPICHISGQTAGTYHNPEPAGTAGKLTLSHSSTLRVGNAGTTHCILGTNDPTTLTAQTFTTTSANPPTIVRTA
jgi:hypothetical protein